MLWSTVTNAIKRRKWAQWDNAPKGLVILHTFGKAYNVPSASPFVMKLQTYLRMAKIPHKIDSKNNFGPKGKIPWVSLNGRHLGDSELIISHLNEHFSVNLNKGPYSKSQLATATCARVALEEHFLWGLAMERFWYNPSQFRKITGNSGFREWVVMTFGQRLVQRRTEGQGLGLHSQSEVEKLCSKDLRAVSDIMGSNRFLLGSEPCQDDAAVFGMLSVALWGLPNSPYEALVKDELTNLKDYCMRLKELYYPDWEKCIRVPKIELRSPSLAMSKL